MYETMREFIAAEAKNEQGLDISVSTVESSVFALVELYKKAVKDIRIYSSSLREDIFGDPEIIDTLRSFIEHDEREISSDKRKLLILCKEIIFPVREHPLLKDLLDTDKHGNIFEIYRAAARPIKDCKSNFSVIDGRAYRLSKEYTKLEEMPKNDSGFLGMVNYHDEETSSYLERLFDKFLRSSQRIGNGDSNEDRAA